MTLLAALLLAAATPADIESVRAVERAWLDAYRSLDAAAMAGLLAEGFTIAYPDGRTEDRARVLDQIARMRTLRPNGPDFVTEGSCASSRGDSVILSGTVVLRGRDGSRRANRYTDTYVRTASGWRVATSVLSAADGEPPPNCR